MNTSQRRKAIAIVVFLVWVVNFTAWFFIGLWLGGYAFLGKVEEGVAYLGSHGGYAPVSGEMFRYSQWHGYAVGVNFVLVCLTQLAVLLSSEHDGLAT